MLLVLLLLLLLLLPLLLLLVACSQVSAGETLSRLPSMKNGPYPWVRNGGIDEKVAGDQFGDTVSINAAIVAIGAPFNDPTTGTIRSHFSVDVVAERSPRVVVIAAHAPM